MKTKTADYFDRAEREATERMFADDKDWVHLVLPVKNRVMKTDDPFGVLGVIANPFVEGKPLIIHETCLYAPDFENSPKHTYASVQEAIAAGWVVD